MTFRHIHYIEDKKEDKTVMILLGQAEAAYQRASQEPLVLHALHCQSVTVTSNHHNKVSLQCKATHRPRGTNTSTP